MSHAPARPASLLVVDDTHQNLRLLGNMLGEAGYEVRPVSNGRQALQAAEHDPPDLILLDVNMPDMDGYEVCRRIKAQDRSKDVPVIFLTAWTDRAHMVKAFEVGGADYVTKPFLFEEVLARVNTHVALSRAREALAQRDERVRELERLHRDLAKNGVDRIRTPLAELTLHVSRLTKRDANEPEGAAGVDLEAMAEATATLNRAFSALLEAGWIDRAGD